jgi:alpha/beta superfamily hydrolase
VALRVQSTPVAGRERVEPALLVVVAPPVGRWDFSMIAAPACPWLVIQGSRDELVDADEVVSWVGALDGSGGLARLARFADADHFFHARLHELRDAVTGFVAEVDQRRSV